MLGGDRGLIDDGPANVKHMEQISSHKCELANLESSFMHLFAVDLANLTLRCDKSSSIWSS